MTSEEFADESQFPSERPPEIDDQIADEMYVDVADDDELETVSEADAEAPAVGQPSGEIESANPDADEELDSLAEPFVGLWNNLISTTNWEKGRIIDQWRTQLVEAGAPATHFSDEAWARRVGGVTAPHVGRLRRVYNRFGEQYTTYDGLYWSHFLAALEWDDAPLWLEGASREGWSVSGMREQRWQANGAVDSQRPTASQIVDVDLDEDITMPAQGDADRKPYDKDREPSTAPVYDEPDFGEEESLSGVSAEVGSSGEFSNDPMDASQSPVQPFAGLSELPGDLSDAMEQLKLAILRHKTSGWNEVTPEAIEQHLNAIGVLMRLE
ncbi:MAG: hypothetical protein AAGA03_09605 [Planctomycetota bacterium]